jgi:hypothetical protein
LPFGPRRRHSWPTPHPFKICVQNNFLRICGTAKVSGTADQKCLLNPIYILKARTLWRT